MFELQPTLTGPSLILRPLNQNDYNELYLAASDPLIWEQHPAYDRYKEDVFRISFFDSGLTSGGALTVVSKQTGNIIGSSRFTGYSQDLSEVAIGWTFLSRAYWGGTHNSEMKSLMLTHAFQFVDSVLFRVGSQNLRSQRAVMKLGATFDKSTKSGEVEGIQYRLRKATYVAITCGT